MNDQTKSVKKKYSLYWLITLLSFLITAVLIWQNSFNKGTLVKISIDSAEGIEAHKTQVKFRSVTVGMVENIHLNEDYTKTIMETRIYPSYDDLLRKDSLFWIVKPRIDTKQISGLSTLFSGSYSELNLGKDDQMSDEFECMNEPPVYAGEDTVNIVIDSHYDRILESTTAIKYKGIEIGQIAGHNYDIKNDRIIYTAKIKKSYASLVSNKAVFWVDSGFSVNFGSSGFNFSIPSLDNLMIGSVNVTTFEHFDQKPLNEWMEFSLYKDYTSAKASTLEDNPKYVILVENNTQDISVGSEVMFRNSKIGEVLEIPYFTDPLDIYDLNKPIPILIVLDIDAEKKAVDKVKAIFDEHIKSGDLCASVGVSNLLLTTGDIINIEINPKKKCSSRSKVYRDYAVIPLVEYESMFDSVHKFGKNLSKVDIEAISKNVNKSLTNLNETILSLNRVVNELESKKTVDKLNKTIVSYNSDSEVYRSLITVLNKLNKSISDLDPTIKKLGQKSNALVFSTSEKDVEPKVSGKM